MGWSTKPDMGQLLLTHELATAISVFSDFPRELFLLNGDGYGYGDGYGDGYGYR